VRIGEASAPAVAVAAVVAAVAVALAVVGQNARGLHNGLGAGKQLLHDDTSFLS
jgi:hypothetical protein